MKKSRSLNVQGLARNDIGLMGAILPKPGNVFVGIDIISGEPSITCHLTHDANYFAYTFGMLGKEPYWSGRQLMIDDIYLGFASMCPHLAHKVQEAWRATWPEGTFVQQWMKDPDVIKDALKKSVRSQAKVAVLGYGYNMGPKKMVTQSYDAGFVVSEADAKASYKAYWKLFSDIKQYADSLVKIREAGKPLYTLFGYRIVCDSYKAYNAMVQGTLSGLMHYFTQLMMEQDYARFITIIHDEDVFELPENRLEDFRKHFQKCVDEVNNELQWGVKIRFGFKIGKSLYHIK